ncbi:MAG TPA: energy-coupling factor transporter transmembrane component T [Candidatus Polarisedimenticolia bacterium]|jgi:energy-coupling factor transport system permease protein
MTYGVFQHRSGFLHRTDATAKMMALAAWFSVALLLSRPAALAGFAILVVVVAVSAGLSGALLRFWKFMTILFVMCAGLWALFSRESGLGRGAWMGLRLTSMLALGLIFLAATRVEEMAVGLQRLGLPFMAAFSLTLAFRLLPLFAGSGAIIVQAQACRGLDVREGGPLARLRRYVPLLVPLVLSSLRTADALAVALESRGLGMHPTRTSVIVSKLGAAEVILVTLSATALAAGIWLKLSGVAI